MQVIILSLSTIPPQVEELQTRLRSPYTCRYKHGRYTRCGIREAQTRSRQPFSGPTIRVSHGLSRRGRQAVRLIARACIPPQPRLELIKSLPLQMLIPHNPAWFRFKSDLAAV